MMEKRCIIECFIKNFHNILETNENIDSIFNSMNKDKTHILDIIVKTDIGKRVSFDFYGQRLKDKITDMCNKLGFNRYIKKTLSVFSNIKYDCSVDVTVSGIIYEYLAHDTVDEVNKKIYVANLLINDTLFVSILYKLYNELGFVCSTTRSNCSQSSTHGALSIMYVKHLVRFGCTYRWYFQKDMCDCTGSCGNVYNVEKHLIVVN